MCVAVSVVHCKLLMPLRSWWCLLVICLTHDRNSAGEISLDDRGAQNLDRENKATYLQPSMDFNEEKHDSILREVEDVDLALQGKKVSSLSPQEQSSCKLAALS